MSNYQFNQNMYQMVARNIKKYRKLRGFSVDDLAKYTEISKSFLEKLEDGREVVAISIYDLYKISVVLDVEINHFFE